MLLWWVFLFAGLLVSSNAAKKINLAFLNTEKVLKALKFNKLDTALVQEVSEKMERTVKENQLTATSFLNPLECAVIKEVCAENDVRFAQLGGFGAGTADRNMLLFAPPGSSIGGVQFTPDEVVDQVGHLHRLYCGLF
ncbi:hypothetical protein B484DRAFT_128254 [Ochromonadaceae sp. CCMP2298]|nr:hypothetical protein B484DRAFT_128254 [Ochromonadaceae sp. CCMP2298]